MDVIVTGTMPKGDEFPDVTLELRGLRPRPRGPEWLYLDYSKIRQVASRPQCRDWQEKILRRDDRGGFTNQVSKQFQIFLHIMTY